MIEPSSMHASALLPAQFSTRHPAAPDDTAQGFLACLFDLQEMLCDASGMAAVSLAPQSERQSAFACMVMLRAFHDARGDAGRSELLVLAPANDAVAEAVAQCGYTLREITLDAKALKAAAGAHTAALLLTQACARELLGIVRGAGGLICGVDIVCSADVDADLLSFPVSDGAHEANAWSVAASKLLAHFLPLPIVARKNDEYRLLAEKDRPLSIGRLSAHLSHSDTLLRSFVLRHTAQASAVQCQPG